MKNPVPGSPSQKGLQSGTDLPEIWDSTQGPPAPACRHGIGGGSLAWPLTLPPQGIAPREEPRKGSCHTLAMLDGCSGTVCAGLLRPLCFSLDFCSVLVFLLSTVSENKDIQNRRIVRLRQVRLWLRGSTGFPVQGRLPSPAQAWESGSFEPLPTPGGLKCS